MLVQLKQAEPKPNITENYLNRLGRAGEQVSAHSTRLSAKSSNAFVEDRRENSEKVATGKDPRAASDSQSIAGRLKWMGWTEEVLLRTHSHRTQRRKANKTKIKLFCVYHTISHETTNIQTFVFQRWALAKYEYSIQCCSEGYFFLRLLLDIVVVLRAPWVQKRLT